MASETVTVTPAAAAPGPPELLPGRPNAIVDLQTSEGVGLVGGQWRYADAHVQEIDFVAVGHADDPLGPGTVPNRTYDVVPHAEGADYDDADWRTLAPHETVSDAVRRGIQLAVRQRSIAVGQGDRVRPSINAGLE